MDWSNFQWQILPDFRLPPQSWKIHFPTFPQTSEEFLLSEFRKAKQRPRPKTKLNQILQNGIWWKEITYGVLKDLFIRIHLHNKSFEEVFCWVKFGVNFKALLMKWKDSFWFSFWKTKRFPTNLLLFLYKNADDLQPPYKK